MNITIAGGGNIGTQFAVHCAEQGHRVTVYTSRPELFDSRLTIVDERGEVTHEGIIRQATHDPAAAFRDAELIWVTLPSTMMRDIAETIRENADDRAAIGVVPGNGGSECAFSELIRRGNPFFGLERVPAIARLVEKGKSVRSSWYRDELHVASLPAAKAGECAAMVSGFFRMPCRVIPNYLNLTMTPSNPILHTSRLRTLFRDWRPGTVYPSLPLFYEEWDDESSELLIAMDEEVQEICRALPAFRLQFVKPLTVHYESPTAEAMTRKLSSIPAFKGLKTPAAESGGGLIPDLSSRYFTADFSYGLAIIRQVAEFAGVRTPNIDETMDWYKAIAGETDTFRFTDYGIRTREDFDRFYLA